MLTCRVNTAVRANGNTTDTSVRARTVTAGPTVKVCVHLLSVLIKASSKSITRSQMIHYILDIISSYHENNILVTI